MKRIWMFALVGALVAAPATAAQTVYDAVAARLQADPALADALGKPSVEIKSLWWMIGTWNVTATVQAGAKVSKPESGTSVVSYAIGETWIETRDTYPEGTQDLGLLTYNIVSNRWVALGIDSTGNAVTTTSDGWRDNRLVLTGDVMIVGVPATLRQTVIKVSNTAYDVTNEQLMPDGSWVLLDHYEYRRR